MNITQPVALVAVVAPENRTPDILRMIRTRLHTEASSAAARLGYNLSAHPIMFVEKEDDRLDTLTITAVVAGAPNLDGQLYGGPEDGRAVALTLTDGWKPLDSLTIALGRSRLIYDRLGVNVRTGQWIYKFARQTDPQKETPRGK